jgi:putative glutamine amidotransferase
VRLPRLAVSGLVQPVKGIDRTGVNVGYVHRLVEAGGLPLVLSPVLGAARAAEALADIDGLLLSGGADIAPARYHAEPSPRLGSVELERDAFELELFTAARARGLPVLAICRGMQLVNVATGGTLWQDLPSERPGAVVHQQAEARSVRTHEVRIQPGTRTANLLGVESLDANSMHHQAVRELGAGLAATGWAADGVIESLESSEDGNWLVGVQWHPEDLGDGGPDDGLFRAFVAAAAARRS